MPEVQMRWEHSELFAVTFSSAASGMQRCLKHNSLPPSLIEVSQFGENLGELRMMLYVSVNLPPSSPLIVVFHGASQSAEGYAEGAGWLSLADRFGFAVLCPEQNKRNNACLAFNWFEPDDMAREGGEAASIRQMVETAVEEHTLDRTRIFITGLSAGGAMTAVMLATYPDIFAVGRL